MRPRLHRAWSPQGTCRTTVAANKPTLSQLFMHRCPEEVIFTSGDRRSHGCTSSIITILDASVAQRGGCRPALPAVVSLPLPQSVGPCTDCSKVPILPQKCRDRPFSGRTSRMALLRGPSFSLGIYHIYGQTLRYIVHSAVSGMLNAR